MMMMIVTFAGNAIAVLAVNYYSGFVWQFWLSCCQNYSHKTLM